MMAEYCLGAGERGIYIGTLDEHGTRWKSECTDEAIKAVRNYILREIPEGEATGGYEWMRADGSIVELRVTIKEAPDACM